MSKPHTDFDSSCGDERKLLIDSHSHLIWKFIDLVFRLVQFMCEFMTRWERKYINIGKSILVEIINITKRAG